MHEEQSATDKEGTNNWIKTLLSNVIENYEEKTFIMQMSRNNLQSSSKLEIETKR